MTAQLVPITVTDARRFVAEHHRHNRPPVSWLFGVGLECGGELIGVAMAGRPVSRHQDDGRTLEITRVCTTGTTRNVNSRMYAALCRAGRALGYLRVLTYTLESESGSSLRAAGFAPTGEARGDNWARRNHERYDTTLWGERTIPEEGRIRWERAL